MYLRQSTATRASGEKLLALVLALTVAPWGGPLASPERVDQLLQSALQLDRHPANGQKLYSASCAACHGARATGDADAVVPSLAAQRRAYLIKQLADFAELDRDGNDMHAVIAQAPLNHPQAWADVAAYLNSLPPPARPQSGDGDGVELGEAIFQEQCASCHDEDARGDDDGFVPSLRGQHYSYLVQQLRALSSSHRRNVDADLVRFLDSFEAEEFTAMADYLSRMRKPDVKDRVRLDSDGTAGD